MCGYSGCLWSFRCQFGHTHCVVEDVTTHTPHVYALFSNTLLKKGGIQRVDGANAARPSIAEQPYHAEV
jgi:hypothetical protein